MPGLRQLTLDDMRRKAAERVRLRVMRLKHEGPPGNPVLLLEAGCALLRRGLCPRARALVLRYVLDDTRRECIYGRDMLVAHFRRAAAATAARAEMLPLLAVYPGHWRAMTKEHRKRLKVLVRAQIQALEPSAYGLERGPLSSCWNSVNVRPVDLAAGLHGEKVVRLALEKTPRAEFTGSLMELYEIRRRLHVEMPPKYMFTF
jgi:hypothetical protein